MPLLPCTNPLGFKTGEISDAQLSASSELSANTTSYYSRLNQPNTAWVAGTDDENQWLEVNMYRQTVITGVNVQGNPSADQWVTRYKVYVSRDHFNWNYVLDEYDEIEVKLFRFNSRFGVFLKKYMLLNYIRHCDSTR